MNCSLCSDATLYPDGALRCDHDNLLAAKACIRHNFGTPKIITIGELLRNRAEALRLAKASKVTVKGTVSKKRKVAKPKQQGRLL